MVEKVATESVAVQVVDQVVEHMEQPRQELLFQDKAMLEDLAVQGLNSLAEGAAAKDLLEAMELVMVMDQEVQEVPSQQEVRQ